VGRVAARFQQNFALDGLGPLKAAAIQHRPEQLPGTVIIQAAHPQSQDFGGGPDDDIPF
jgi:hypothetical protein